MVWCGARSHRSIQYDSTRSDPWGPSRGVFLISHLSSLTSHATVQFPVICVLHLSVHGPSRLFRDPPKPPWEILDASAEEARILKRRRFDETVLCLVASLAVLVAGVTYEVYRVLRLRIRNRTQMRRIFPIG